MTPFISGLADAARDINNERGGVALFALLEPADSMGLWDLIVSAEWVLPNELAALHYIVGKVRSRVSLEDYLTLSRIIVLGPSEPFVRAITTVVRASAGNPPNEVHQRAFDGIELSHAYIFISDPDAKPDPSKPLPWPTAQEAAAALVRGQRRSAVRDANTGRFVTKSRSTQSKPTVSRRGGRTAK